MVSAGLVSDIPAAYAVRASADGGAGTSAQVTATNLTRAEVPDRPHTCQGRGMTTSTHTDLAALAARRSEDLADGTATDEDIAAALGEMVAHPDYPCLGARSVFRRDAARVLVLPDLGDASVGTLAGHLRDFATTHDGRPELASFLAVFRSPVPSSEAEFESALWSVLQRLHDGDTERWAADVASDPADPRFAFSIGGTPYFIVGLHPAASRIARRAPVPTIVFNLHRQFERLRSEDTFARMRTAIRRRDERLQGSVNPMVDDYGSASAARQYSGRAVEAQWRAPFCPKGARR